mmetsp:Transcript_15176/g.25787  ORF Transcript_15176/g.25787 Transcript_15176/m.25787 type:complete len:301 (+) Transcript_15176:562-1464(+)
MRWTKKAKLCTSPSATLPRALLCCTCARWGRKGWWGCRGCPRSGPSNCGRKCRRSVQTTTDCHRPLPLRRRRRHYRRRLIPRGGRCRRGRWRWAKLSMARGRVNSNNKCNLARRRRRWGGVVLLLANHKSKAWVAVVLVVPLSPFPLLRSLSRLPAQFSPAAAAEGVEASVAAAVVVVVAGVLACHFQLDLQLWPCRPRQLPTLQLLAHNRRNRNQQAVAGAAMSLRTCDTNKTSSRASPKRRNPPRLCIRHRLTRGNAQPSPYTSTGRYRQAVQENHSREPVKQRNRAKDKRPPQFGLG